MMRHPDLTLRLHLLHRIIQEKINQNRIHLGARMLLYYFPAYELDAPDAAAAELELPGVGGRDGL